MEIIGIVGNLILVAPITNLLVGLYKLFVLVGLPGPLGWSILSISVLIRLLMWSLTAKQIKSTQKMVQLKPHLEIIKKQYGHDKTRHMQEQQKLYKEHGINPMAGCLPLLLQMPIFIALYNVFNSVLGGDGGISKFVEHFNNQVAYFGFLRLDETLNVNFLGTSLISRPMEWQTIGWWILLIPVGTALLQLVQSKMMMPKPPVVAVRDSKKEIKEKESTEEMMTQIQGQMLFLMPLMFGFISYQLPVGLAVFWNTLTIFGIIQQYKITGLGGLEPWMTKLSKQPKN
ncbi:membrane protein insertase YidC [Candidatus Daviesbacteria bacterium]|nr:membrane protein insertase YidC [Candidatus Daviesbacteria bacterium]